MSWFWSVLGLLPTFLCGVIWLADHVARIAALVWLVRAIRGRRRRARRAKVRRRRRLK